MQRAMQFIDAWLEKLQKEAKAIARLFMWHLELRLFGNDTLIVLGQLVKVNWIIKISYD